MGFHCSDCVFATITRHKDSGRYQGSCSRGYTLSDPRARGPESHFVDAPDKLVPTVTPLGTEYLRTSNVCESFLRPQDAPRA